MFTHIAHDSPQTFYAASRVVKPVKLLAQARGWLGDDPRIAERMLAKLRGAGFGVTNLGHDRMLVTPGEVDVEGAWRRARAVTRALCVRSHAVEERFAERLLAKVREREEAGRQAAERFRLEVERAAEDAELEFVAL